MWQMRTNLTHCKSLFLKRPTLFFSGPNTFEEHIKMPEIIYVYILSIVLNRKCIEEKNHLPCVGGSYRFVSNFGLLQNV